MLSDHGEIIRAQLQEKKQLKLPVQTDIEKAFDNNETEKLSAEATESKSSHIHLAFVLARNADMRDAEIRALTGDKSWCRSQNCDFAF